MLQIIGTIPNLTDTTCEALLCQQYWYQGELVTDVSVLFLKPENHLWQRFFFDYGVLFWKQVDAPDVWYTTPQEEFHYPKVDLGKYYNLVGRKIREIEVIDAERRPAVFIKFSPNTTVILADAGDQVVLTIG